MNRCQQKALTFREERWRTLWSKLRGMAVPSRQRTPRESPQLATTMWSVVIIATTAVVPVISTSMMPRHLHCRQSFLHKQEFSTTSSILWKHLFRALVHPSLFSISLPPGSPPCAPSCVLSTLINSCSNIKCIISLHRFATYMQIFVYLNYINSCTSSNWQSLMASTMTMKQCFYMRSSMTIVDAEEMHRQPPVDLRPAKVRLHGYRIFHFLHSSRHRHHSENRLWRRRLRRRRQDGQRRLCVVTGRRRWRSGITPLLLRQILIPFHGEVGIPSSALSGAHIHDGVREQPILQRRHYSFYSCSVNRDLCLSRLSSISPVPTTVLAAVSHIRFYPQKERRESREHLFQKLKRNVNVSGSRYFSCHVPNLSERTFTDHPLASIYVSFTILPFFWKINVFYLIFPQSILVPIRWIEMQPHLNLNSKQAGSGHWPLQLPRRSNFSECIFYLNVFFFFFLRKQDYVIC